MLYFVSNLTPCITFVKFNIVLKFFFYVKMSNFDNNTQIQHCIRDILNAKFDIAMKNTFYVKISKFDIEQKMFLEVRMTFFLQFLKKKPFSSLVQKSPILAGANTNTQ